MIFKENIKTKRLLFGIGGVSLLLLFLFVVLISFESVLAGSPSGNNYFQIFTNKTTGADNSGDGGSGNPSDLNYYYVGQSFTGNISINSNSGTNASNVWIDYDKNKIGVSGLSTGTFFPSWAGQIIDDGRVKSTGYRVSGYSYGLGTFGSIDITALAPSAQNYSTSSPASLAINIGDIGNTTESNISRDGLDLLDSKEDFLFHIWADTKKPYAKNPMPADGSLGVSVEDAFSFDLRDSKGGEANDGGVGTGINLSSPSKSIIVNDGSQSINITNGASYSCSGVWATNLCSVSVSLPSVTSISSDTRKWEYGKNYTIVVGGYQDKASGNQSQLGDANGPNTMDSRTWTFSTEQDTVKPRVSGEQPPRGSDGVSVSAGITVDIVDKKYYPGNTSGSGVDPSTCKINLSSFSAGTVTYQQGSPGFSVAPIDYGYRYSIIPGQPFTESETVSVAVYDCSDYFGNTMVADNYTFSTADSLPPYVDEVYPGDDEYISPDGEILFYIKDSGSGVDLSKTVIFVNGVYYTKSGGAGSVTNSGTKINYSSSLSFSGGNYSGDTTNVSPDINSRRFLINPPNNFTPGEAVPVIIYTSDISGNTMERFVYSLIVSGGGSDYCDGRVFCGPRTSWDGANCIGHSGGGASYPFIPDCPAIDSLAPQIKPSTVQAIQIDESSVMISFFSNIKGKSWVVYGDTSLKDYGNAPNFGYPKSTKVSNSDSAYHSFVIKDLVPGKTYYLVPVFSDGETVVRGGEVKISLDIKKQEGKPDNICKPEIIEKVIEKVIFREIIVEVARGEGRDKDNLSGENRREFIYGVSGDSIGSKIRSLNQDLATMDIDPGDPNLRFSGKTVPFGFMAITIY